MPITQIKTLHFKREEDVSGLVKSIFDMTTLVNKNTAVVCFNKKHEPMSIPWINRGPDVSDRIVFNDISIEMPMIDVTYHVGKG